MARILVIDDDEPIRRILRRALEADGHVVFEASDGKMGIGLLALEPVEVVITDIFMPEQDGIQTLREIRKDFPNVKVIAMSGGDSTGQLNLRAGAEALGAIRSLQKPFTAREVQALVREVVKG